MRAEALLSELERLGVRLEIKGDRLRVDAPSHVWTPELRAKVAAAKADLIAALRHTPFYSITVDGSPVATAASMAEALDALAATVRSMDRTPGRTIKVELQDATGKPLRICYLPPWEGKA